MSDFPPTNAGAGLAPGPDGAFERFLTAAIATIITIMFSWRMLVENEDCTEQQAYENIRQQILQKNTAGAISPQQNKDRNHNSTATDTASRDVATLAHADAISTAIRTNNFVAAPGVPLAMDRDQILSHTTGLLQSLPAEFSRPQVVTNINSVNKPQKKYENIITDSENKDNENSDSLFDSGYQSITANKDVSMHKEESEISPVHNVSEYSDHFSEDFASGQQHFQKDLTSEQNINIDKDDKNENYDSEQPMATWGDYDWEEDAYSRVNTRRTPREFTSNLRTKSESSGSDQSYTAVSDFSDNELNDSIPIDGSEDIYSNQEYQSILDIDKNKDIAVNENSDIMSRFEISDSDSDTSTSDSESGDYEPQMFDSDHGQNHSLSKSLEPIIEEDSDDEIVDEDDENYSRCQDNSDILTDDSIKSLDDSDNFDNKCPSLNSSGDINDDDTGHSSHSNSSACQIKDKQYTLPDGITDEPNPEFIKGELRTTLNENSENKTPELLLEKQDTSLLNSLPEHDLIIENSCKNSNTQIKSEPEGKLDLADDVVHVGMFTTEQQQLQAACSFNKGQSSRATDFPPFNDESDKSQIPTTSFDNRDKNDIANFESPSSSPVHTCALDDVGEGYISDESCSSESIVTVVSVRSFDGEMDENKELTDLLSESSADDMNDGDLTPERLPSDNEYNDSSDSEECLDDEGSYVTKSDSVIHIPHTVDAQQISREIDSEQLSRDMDNLPETGSLEYHVPSDIMDGEGVDVNYDNNSSVSAVAATEQLEQSTEEFNYCDFVKNIEACSEPVLERNEVSISNSINDCDPANSDLNPMSNFEDEVNEQNLESVFENIEDDVAENIDTLSSIERLNIVNNEENIEYNNNPDIMDLNDNINELSDSEKETKHTGVKFEGNEIDGTFYITSNILKEEPIYTDSSDDDSEGPREYNPYEDDFAEFCYSDEDDEDSFFMVMGKEDDSKIKKLNTVTNLNAVGLNTGIEDYEMHKHDDGTVVFTKTQEIYTDHQVRLYTKQREDIPDIMSEIDIPPTNANDHDEENITIESELGSDHELENTSENETEENTEHFDISNHHVPNGEIYSIAEEDEISDNSDETTEESKCQSENEINRENETNNIALNENEITEIKPEIPNLDFATYLIGDKHKSPVADKYENQYSDFKSSEDSISADLSPSTDSLDDPLHISEEHDSGIQCNSSSPSDNSINKDINEIIPIKDVFPTDIQNPLDNVDKNNIVNDGICSKTSQNNTSQDVKIDRQTKETIIDFVHDYSTIDEDRKNELIIDQTITHEKASSDLSSDAYIDTSKPEMCGAQQAEVDCDVFDSNLDDVSTLGALEMAMAPCLEQYERTMDDLTHRDSEKSCKDNKSDMPVIIVPQQGWVVRQSVVTPSSFSSPATGVKARINRSQSAKKYSSVLSQPIPEITRSTSFNSPDSKTVLPASRTKIISSRQRFLSADNLANDSLSPIFDQFKASSMANTSISPRPRRFTPKRDSTTKSRKVLSFERVDHITDLYASRISQSDDSYEKPEIDHLHKNCMFSPHKHEEIDSLNESIDNLQIREQLLRYGSVSSLMETDLDTGQTFETRVLTDFDMFEFQHEPLQRTASLGDIVHKMYEEKRPSGSGGRFANRNVPKSKSLMTLETDIDEVCAAPGEGNLTRVPSVHELRVAKSLSKLNVPDWYKKSSVSRSGSTYSLFERRDSNSTLNSIGYSPSVVSSPLPSMSPTNSAVVIRTRVTPSASRLLRSPKLPITPEKSPLSHSMFQLPSQRLRQRDKGREPMPVSIVPFCQIRKMFEVKSSEQSMATSASSSTTVKKTPSTKSSEKPPSLSIMKPVSVSPEVSSPSASSPRSPLSPVSPSDSKKVSFEEDVKPVVNVAPVDAELPRVRQEEPSHVHVKNGKVNNEVPKNKPAVQDKPRKEKGSPKKSEGEQPTTPTKKGFFSGGLRMPRLGKSKSSPTKPEIIVDQQPNVEEETVKQELPTVPPKPEKKRQGKLILYIS